ncbi:Basic-leucine zipper (bZIP) transcription factor family protein [Rhynchospora pubera]|uniref:Basic-leucine zipper (BZIP) transcription factor family protein n=1 Tax=Rhynchospora pubera TaxID=906938 RepID=A0AAV8FCN3_9POAL|nr:Basic-leucine zipper (bZIP) transcription factor family protein [Rhynchospora pubera]
MTMLGSHSHSHQREGAESEVEIVKANESVASAAAAAAAAAASSSHSHSHSRSQPLDPVDHALMLKEQLLIYCAAVANGTHSHSTAVATTCLPHLPTHTQSLGDHGIIFNLPHSSSSKDLSDEDEEAEEEEDLAGTLDPANVKRMRRMISNRESARRSRKRKQAHLNDLEAEVSQLRVENSSLLKRLSHMTQKYNDASADNRVLRADVETLQAKVKMAEDTVKRVTGSLQISDISELRIPFYRTPPDEISDAAVPAKDAANLFSEPNSKFISPSEIDPTGVVINRTGRKMGRSYSLHRVASLECLQKRICSGHGPCEPNQWDAIMPDGSGTSDN